MDTPNFTSRLLALCLTVLCGSQSAEAQPRSVADYVPVTDAMLRDPDPGDWLMVHRTYDFQAFSPLDEINRDNVGELRLAWMRAMDEGPQQFRPLVHGGIMYIANPGSDHLQALDATTGDLVWDYRWETPADLREYSQLGDRRRNIAIYGDHILHLTGDAHLIAVDARTGELAWESEMADYRTGMTHSSGAMVIDGRVMSGRACSPGRADVRCFIAAHDAATGREAWRFYTAAGADDPGGQTWGNVPPSRRGHVSPWGLPGSYDPELGLVYWGIAVPSPYTRIVRHGAWDIGDATPCELYTNSTVALRVDTGALDWYYQYLPCDDWDQDFVQERTLIDIVVDPDPDAVRWINPAVASAPRERKVVVTIGEPGGLFVNDRETGEFLWAAPLPYTSTERFVIRDIDPATGQVFINTDLVAKAIGERHVICGHNVKGWWSWSYSPQTGLLYIPFNRSCLDQTANDRSVTGTGPRFTIPEPGLEEDGDLTELRAIDISTGREAWRYSQRAPNAGSALATGGSLVFHGDLNRRFRAFDAESGEVLWETILGSQITGYPVSYTAGGRQYVTVPVGGAAIFRMDQYAPELEAPIGSNMLVTFALPE